MAVDLVVWVRWGAGWVGYDGLRPFWYKGGGHRVAYFRSAGLVVRVVVAAGDAGVGGGAGRGRCVVGRPAVLRAVPAVLQRDGRAAVDPDRDVSSAHVLEVSNGVGL